MGCDVWDVMCGMCCVEYVGYVLELVGKLRAICLLWGVCGYVGCGYVRCDMLAMECGYVCNVLGVCVCGEWVCKLRIKCRVWSVDMWAAY